MFGNLCFNKQTSKGKYGRKLTLHLCDSCHQEALEWLGGYMPGDLVIAELKGSSNSLWTISPPSRKTLIDMLALDEDFPITVSWSVQRNLSLGAKAETASGKQVTNLANDTKKALVLLLSGNDNQSHV